MSDTPAFKPALPGRPGDRLAGKVALVTGIGAGIGRGIGHTSGARRERVEPGERLRVDDLSQRLDISSSPVREALNRLAQQHFVRALDNRGFRVAPLTVEGITDLTRVRVLVEVEVLRDAIAHGDDAWEAAAVAAAHSLGRVEERLGDQPVALDNEWSERHRAFHLALYAACTSPLLVDLADHLFDSAERYRRYSAKHRAVDRAKHNEHRDLLRSVLSRDAEAATQRELRARVEVLAKGKTVLDTFSFVGGKVEQVVVTIYPQVLPVAVAQRALAAVVHAPVHRTVDGHRGIAQV